VIPRKLTHLDRDGIHILIPATGTVPQSPDEEILIRIAPQEAIRKEEEGERLE